MLNTARSKKIEAYIKTHPNQKIKNRQIDIAYGGSIHPHPVYRLLTNDLIHNIRNGRFRAELLEREEQLKRKLDPTKKSDGKIIRELLLNQNPSETEALREDIIKNGQLFPGIITFDGAVINGNRRMAILQTLHEETRQDKYKYLLVGRLPQEVDELDLWKIVAGLQFGRDFKLDYGGINELLKLREGAKQGLSAKDISVALIGRFTKNQVQEKLDILKLIDSYLSFTNQKGEYHKITVGQDLEKFVSLQKNVITSLGKKFGKGKQEIAELTAIGFTLIKIADVTHWNIRELRNISNNPKADAELRAPFNGKIPVSIGEVKLKKDTIEEAFRTAMEIVEIASEGSKPERLLKSVKSSLEGINEKSKKLKEPALVLLLKDIKNRLDAIIKASKK